MLNEYSPIIPFEKPFYGTISPGFIITINGHVPHGCSLFAINLKCGQSLPGYPEPNNALHMSFRFNERKIVRNTHIPANGWGPEEVSGGFPLAQNAPFQLNIYAENFGFKILINNTFFADYKYRLPLNTVQVLSISGSVNIYQINSQSPGAIGVPSMKHHSKSGIGHAPPPAYSAFPGLPLFLNAVAVPTTVQIPGNMRAGMSFSISGTPLHGKRFDCNLITTNSDYALHISSRLQEMTVVRNHKISSSWGTEERAASFFPFSSGVIFHLLIKCEPTHFQILINGQLFAHFNHRIHPITNVNSLNISGDVIIHSINITA